MNGFLSLLSRWAFLLVLVLATSRGIAADYQLAGSIQSDYHFTSERFRKRPDLLDGATVEASLKLSADISDNVSANVKICLGCHGFETDMAYVDYRIMDELNVRVGRFSPSFGSFNVRHDPGNHRMSDKPLPYDMGRMVRFREWNNGVLPSPFPDNGIEINGTHWFGKKVQFDYAVYAVSGFKADRTSMDIDFVESRSGSLYYVDNNGLPTGGGRVATTIRLGERDDMTLGASGMFGTLDPKNANTYLILGADFAFRVRKTTLRAEYLLRRQDFDASEPARFKYALVDAFFLKQGAFVELEGQISKKVDLLLRLDALYRTGNVLAESPFTSKNGVGRVTVGSAVTLRSGFRLKSSVEYWRFTNGAPLNAASLHLAAVATF